MSSFSKFLLRATFLAHCILIISLSSKATGQDSGMNTIDSTSATKGTESNVLTRFTYEPPATERAKADTPVKYDPNNPAHLQAEIARIVPKDDLAENIQQLTQSLLRTNDIRPFLEAVQRDINDVIAVAKREGKPVPKFLVDYDYIDIDISASNFKNLSKATGNSDSIRVFVEAVDELLDEQLVKKYLSNTEVMLFRGDFDYDKFSEELEDVLMFDRVKSETQADDETLKELRAYFSQHGEADKVDFVIDSLKFDQRIGKVIDAPNAILSDVKENFGKIAPSKVDAAVELTNTSISNFLRLSMMSSLAHAAAHDYYDQTLLTQNTTEQEAKKPVTKIKESNVLTRFTYEPPATERAKADTPVKYDPNNPAHLQAEIARIVPKDDLAENIQQLTQSLLRTNDIRPFLEAVQRDINDVIAVAKREGKPVPKFLVDHGDTKIDNVSNNFSKLPRLTGNSDSIRVFVEAIDELLDEKHIKDFIGGKEHVVVRGAFDYDEFSSRAKLLLDINRVKSETQADDETLKELRTYYSQFGEADKVDFVIDSLKFDQKVGKVLDAQEAIISDVRENFGKIAPSKVEAAVEITNTSISGFLELGMMSSLAHAAAHDYYDQKLSAKDMSN